jgi:hypothetical protein
MIRTIGLHWHTDDVFWGKGPKAGSLLGVLSSKKKSPAVDFREQIAVYVLYADFQPIYAGQVGSGKQRLLARLKQHRDSDLRGRWNRFSWYGLRSVLKTGKLSNENSAFHPLRKTVLNHVEGILIDAMEPGQNLQSGRFGAEVEWYRQVRSPSLPLSGDDMLRALYKAEQDRANAVEKQAAKGRQR